MWKGGGLYLSEYDLDILVFLPYTPMLLSHFIHVGKDFIIREDGGLRFEDLWEGLI